MLPLSCSFFIQNQVFETINPTLTPLPAPLSRGRGVGGEGFPNLVSPLPLLLLGRILLSNFTEID
jgi:hypothetical protein